MLWLSFFNYVLFCYSNAKLTKNSSHLRHCGASWRQHKQLPMKVKAIYPGTFDPLTNGHSDLVLRAARLFDSVVVGVASKLASMNRQLNPELDSLFMTPSEKNTFISSTLVKEVCRHGGDISSFVPAHVERALTAKFSKV